MKSFNWQSHLSSELGNLVLQTISQGNLVGFGNLDIEGNLACGVRLAKLS